MSEIRGATALVTGGASGIGRRLAGMLARRGARVVLWDIDRARLDATVTELVTEGLQAFGLVCDVTDRVAVAATAERVQREVGGIDILVNNAGVVSGRSFLALPEEQIERTFAVNTLALFWTTRAFLPEMIRRNRGHVVTVASAAGLVGVVRLADYCASKWAAVGFDESLRMELRRTAPGVATTVVCPYFIDTGMFEGVRTRFPLLLPILDEEKVAGAIVRAIAGNRRKLVTPPFARLLPLMRLLPLRLFDTLADFFGINAAMDHFVGRPSSAEGGRR